MARHDRLVSLVAKDLKNINQGYDCTIFLHNPVKMDWFNHNNADNNFLKTIPNTPDIVMVNTSENVVLIIEVGCCFDFYMDTCYYSKQLIYQPLQKHIVQLGYECKLIVLIFGSLGHIHKNVVRGLQIAGLQKGGAKTLAKFCSVSAIIGSMQIWRRRCFVYP